MFGCNTDINYFTVYQYNEHPYYPVESCPTFEITSASDELQEYFVFLLAMDPILHYTLHS